MEDGILWSAGPVRYRVKGAGKLAGADPLDYEDLLSHLVAVRQVDPAIDRYQNKEGHAARVLGLDAEGLPIVELGEADPAQADRYAPVSAALDAMREWSQRRPSGSAAPPELVARDPSAGRAALREMQNPPLIDRGAMARRALESGGVASLVALLAGGGSRAALAGFTGGARGASRAIGTRFADAAALSKARAAGLLQEAKLSAGDTDAANALELRRYAAELAGDKGGLSEWQGEGKALESQLKGVIASLGLQRADRAQEATAATGAARVEIARDAQEDTEKDRSERRDMAWEAQDWKESSEEAKARARAESERLKRLEGEAKMLRSSLERGNLSSRDRAAARLRLAEIKKFANVGPGDSMQDPPGLTPSQRQGASDRAASRASSERRAASRGAADLGPDGPGPKSTPLEKWLWLGDEQKRLQGDRKAAQARVDALKGVARRSPAQEQDLVGAQDELDHLTRFLQSRVNEVVKLEAQYPEIKKRGLARRSSGGSGGSRSVKTKSGRTVFVED